MPIASVFRHGLYLLSLIYLANVSHGILQVEIATLGTVSPAGLTISLIYTRPPMDAAVKELRERYGHVFNLTHTYIYDEQVASCYDVQTNSDYMLSEWYYKRRVKADLYAFISPTCIEYVNVNRLTAQWNTLMFTSAATGAFEFRNKTISPTRVTTGAVSLTNFAKLVANILTTFNWQSVYMVLDISTGGMNLAFSVPAMETIKRMPYSQLHIARINPVTTQTDYTIMLQEFRNISRGKIEDQIYAYQNFIKINACLMNMTNGEYVYLYVDFLKELEGLNWKRNDQFDSVAREAFRSLLVLSSDDSIYDLPSPAVCDSWTSESLRRFNVTAKRSDLFWTTATSYAAVSVFGTVLNDTITTNPDFDFKNGKEFAKRFFNRTYSLNFTDIYIDNAGERITKLWIRELDRTSGTFKPVIYQDEINQELHAMGVIDWGGANVSNEVPLNIPLCGYRGDQGPCAYQDNVSQAYGIAFGTASAVLVVALACIMYWMRRWIVAGSERWWELDANYVLFAHDAQFALNTFTNIKALLRNELSRTNSGFELEHKNAKECSEKAVETSLIYGGVKALYMGDDVWVQSFYIPGNTNINKKLLEKSTILTLLPLFKQFRNHAHLNVNGFRGTCVSETLSRIHFVSTFCQRGSLHDLFERFHHFDPEHCSSLVMDVLDGMRYIHNSVIGFHGNLTGWKCLIDNRFTLKISEFGFNVLKSQLLNVAFLQELAEFPSEALYWTAPELLRQSYQQSKTTDMYSLGVVLHEIMAVTTPFKYTLTSAEPIDIINRIRAGETEPLRPDVEPSLEPIPVTLTSIIRQCWDETPAARPTIQKVHEIFSKEFKVERHGKNLVDKLMRRLDDYAQGLEDEVYIRTNELIAEQKKCDVLLQEMLPRLIIAKLRDGQLIQPELFENVTVMFSDLYGFTEIAMSKTPIEITDLLNILYSIFDPVLQDFDVYKVETIGNVYMVASGVPLRNGVDHVRQISSLTLSLHDSFLKYSRTDEISFRAGIHAGPCAAGVMGLKNPRYCLFGDTVNTASRMGSHSLPNKIHMSNIAADLLRQFSEFNIVERGLMEIKGKGIITTYWLER